jgi:hypothetical protein
MVVTGGITLRRILRRGERGSPPQGVGREVNRPCAGHVANAGGSMSHLETRTVKTAGLLALGVLAVFATCPSPAAAAEPVLRLRAFAVNMSGVGRTSAQTLDIVIDRWSTDAERKTLFDTLKEKPDNLLDVLQKIKPRAGYIRTATSLGWDIEFARKYRLPGGGERIIFATDRPMSFYELLNNTRSSDYEFMFGEIHLAADGTGEGKLSTAAKIRWIDYDKALEIEDYATEPVRLSQVRVVK